MMIWTWCLRKIVCIQFNRDYAPNSFTACIVLIHTDEFIESRKELLSNNEKTLRELRSGLSTSIILLSYDHWLWRGHYLYGPAFALRTRVLCAYNNIIHWYSLHVHVGYAAQDIDNISISGVGFECDSSSFIPALKPQAISAAFNIDKTSTQLRSSCKPMNLTLS